MPPAQKSSAACQCGCGELASPGRKYRNGHNARAQRKTLVSVICIHCRKEKWFRPGVAKGRQFCSAACFGAVHSKNMSGPSNPNYAQSMIDCRVCGTPFLCLPSRVKSRTCSPACGRAAQIAALKAKPRKATREGCEAIKAEAKERDNNCCRMCGFSQVVHIHHIIPRRQKGAHAVENLITLCPNDHALAHAGILTVAHLLKAIAQPATFEASGPSASVDYRSEVR